MIVDTSVLVSLVKKEPGADALAELLIRSSGSKASAATYLEAGIVIDSLGDPVLSRSLDEYLHLGDISIEPVTVEQAKVAREAYRDYGRRGGHPAKLNFGDCFSYALARVTGEPLLYKGDDFSHTDLRSAAPRP